MKRTLFIIVLFSACTLPVAAQVAVDLSAYGIKVQTKGSSGSNVAASSAGTIDSSVEMEGIAVINDDVYIDGEKVPKGQRDYKSRKSGKTYEITRDKNGNVAVREK